MGFWLARLNQHCPVQPCGWGVGHRGSCAKPHSDTSGSRVNLTPEDHFWPQLVRPPPTHPPPLLPQPVMVWGPSLERSPHSRAAMVAGEGEKKAGRGGLVWATDKTLTEIALLRPSWSCWEGYRHKKAPSPLKELRSQAPWHVATQLHGPAHPGSLPSTAPHCWVSLPAASDLPGISGPLLSRTESTASSRPSTCMERELEETGPRAPASAF